tara:strand:- start:89 stop:994 length:906 start_codon:yes stop_codon:yes gene_type:complete
MNYDVFENLDFLNIESLYKLSLDHKNNLVLIKNLYLRSNKDLQETLNFLIDLDILVINSNSLSVKSGDDFQNLLLNQVRSKPKYSLPLKNYLQNFISAEDKLINFKPNLGFNILTSGLRNFLITAKILKHNIDNNDYQLLDRSLLDKVKKFEFSPQQLDLEIDKQKKIGLEAEKLVFIKETNEVLNLDKNLEPDHVSLRDVSAGYDIRSFAKINDRIKEIFIEVKAVSSTNYKFHLSAGEYQKAIKNLENYFLYLLPVDYSLKEMFNYEKILKINNLQYNIFDNKSYWSHQNDGYLVYKNN